DGETLKAGSRIAIKHNMTGRYLHFSCGAVQPGASGQELAVANQWSAEPNDFWQIFPAQGDAPPPGTPVRYGQIIRLRHCNTNRYLHSHSGVKSPSSGQQEVTVWDGNDENDQWVVRRWNEYNNEGAQTGEWQSGHSFCLQHLRTGAYLHSHDASIGNFNEVTGFSGDREDENSRWVV
ncbi:MAG: MIR motif-containing protein, partial [Piptocephalis tieghemiana]